MTDTQHVPWPGGGPDPSEASAAPAPAAVEDPSPGISRRIISGIRQNKALPIDHIHVACYNFIATHELKCGGSFIHADKKSWLFNGLDSRVYEIDIKNRAFTSYLALKYGLLKTEAITQHIVAALDAFTQAKGEQREVRRFTFFDRETQTLYVSRYNGTCYRLDGDSVDIVPNGSGALFVDDDGGVPVQADIAPHGILLDRLVNDLQYVHATESGTPPEVQKRLLTLWLFAVGMPDLFPTKPLLLITGEKGSGKCLGRGTPILMFDGTVKPVEDVVNGDLVMGPDSTPRKVCGVTSGKSNLFRIEPTKGDPWVCNDTHIMTVATSGKMNRQGQWRHRGDVVDAPITDFYSCKDGSKLSKQGYSMLIRKGVEFAAKDVKLDPYLLGLWLGDGTSEAPAITNSEPEVMAYCHQIAEKYATNLVTRFDQPKNTWNIHFSKKTGAEAGNGRTNKVLDAVRECLVDGEKRIPREYLVNSSDVRLQTLAGLLDTDGYLSGNCFEITTKYVGLSDDILFLARSLGLAAYRSVKKATIKSTGFSGTYQRILISGDVARIPCKVARRKAAPRKQVKDALRTGFRIHPIGPGEYYGFSVDGDGRFLLGDFTVTHNSTAIQRVQIVVHGKDSTQSVSQKGEEDFGVTLLRTPIALLDNVDKVVDWLPDALCAYATGGGWMRRKKYTDADIIEVRPQAFIALATKNPATFRRDDVADRTLVIRLERRSADGGFLALDTIRQELFRDRDKLFGEWLYYLNAIIAEIRKGTAPARSSHRMADFAATSAVIGRAIGLDEAAVDSALTAAQDERDSMSLEGDILLDVLDKWLETTTNQNREITAAVLHHELSAIATDAGRKNFYKNARTLAQRIREAESGLGRHFHVRKRDGANGTQLYQFSWAK